MVDGIPTPILIVIRFKCCRYQSTLWLVGFERVKKGVIQLLSSVEQGRSCWTRAKGLENRGLVCTISQSAYVIRSMRSLTRHCALTLCKEDIISRRSIRGDTTGRETGSSNAASRRVDHRRRGLDGAYNGRDVVQGDGSCPVSVPGRAGQLLGSVNPTKNTLDLNNLDLNNKLLYSTNKAIYGNRSLLHVLCIV